MYVIQAENLKCSKAILDSILKKKLASDNFNATKIRPNLSNLNCQIIPVKLINTVIINQGFITDSKVNSVKKKIDRENSDLIIFKKKYCSKPHS